MKPIERSLAVFRHEARAGTLYQLQGGGYAFRYDDAYLTEKALPLSTALPLSDILYEGTAVTAVFSGILPDERMRERVARVLGVSTKNTFALLQRLGGER